MQVMVILIVASIIGTVLRGLKSGLIVGNGGRIKTIETTTLSRSARILQRVLET